jgi:hypothetical protein
VLLLLLLPLLLSAGVAANRLFWSLLSLLLYSGRAVVSCDLISGVVDEEESLLETVEEDDRCPSIPTSNFGNCVVVCAAVLHQGRTFLAQESWG